MLILLICNKVTKLLKKMMKTLKNFQWKTYFIASLIVSIGALIIHFKDYLNPSINLFFMWLPVVWVMVFVMAFLFTLLLGGEK